MNVRFGSQVFVNVAIPLLWGKRAIVGHPGTGHLSIVDLSGPTALPEIVADQPWQGVEYSNQEDGFVIFSGGNPAFFYSPPRKILRDLGGSLPECEVSKNFIRIGTNTISNSMITGSQVGVGVSEDGFFIGGPLPSGLAPLIV